MLLSIQASMYKLWSYKDYSDAQNGTDQPLESETLGYQNPRNLVDTKVLRSGRQFGTTEFIALVDCTRRDIQYCSPVEAVTSSSPL